MAWRTEENVKDKDEKPMKRNGVSLVVTYSPQV